MHPPVMSILRIGTRGSPLALAQAHWVRDGLRAHHPDLAGEDAIEIVVIKTSGDRFQDRKLSEIGGKGLFTKEIEEALLEGRIDLAQHSMKDVPTVLPPGLEIACLLPREDPRDAFFSPHAADLDGLPAGARVGTSSLRRQALVLARRPDLTVLPLRGNVDTRLAKLAAGEVDATLLAVAGLNRLGRADTVQTALSVEQMLPAVSQGTVGLEIRADDAATRARIAPLHCPETARRTAAERALLAALDGDCRTPIAALATLTGGLEDRAAPPRLSLTGLLAHPMGERVVQETVSADVEDDAAAAALGSALGDRLKREAGPALLAAL